MNTAASSYTSVSGGSSDVAGTGTVAIAWQCMDATNFICSGL
jgi:hypothetical protein